MNSYCGELSNFTLFSTSNLFDIEFEMSDSLGHEEYSDDINKIKTRKGFRAYFKFSKNFADLSFITGTHVTGTSKLLFKLEVAIYTERGANITRTDY